MTPPQRLQIELLSDTTFGRGEGTAGVVDVEVEHDAAGLPLVRGKMLHGLLRDAWLSMAPVFPQLREAAGRVLGLEGDLAETSLLRIGDGVLPGDLRAWVRFAVERPDQPLSADQVLRTLTDIRRQTARDRATGTSEKTTLRSSRVILRGLRFSAPLTWLLPPEPAHLQVLAMAALGTRHAGQGRQRGRGHVQISLDGDGDATRQIAGGAA